MERPKQLVRFGVFEFDPETGDLWKGERRSRLQHQSRQVLSILVTRSGQLVLRDELRRLLWPDDTFVDFDTGLNVVITKVRHALDDSASTPRFIETIPRRGYRFIAPVAAASPVAEVVLGPSAGAVVPDVPRAAQIPLSSQGSRQSPATGRPAWLAAAGLVAAVATGGWLVSRERGSELLSASRSLAVLPFENLSGDASQSYVADGIAESLTTDLASIRALRVVPRQSTKRYRTTSMAVSEIARELGVAVVVQGSVVRSGDRIRMTLQLTDAVADRNLWAGTFEREVREVTALQHEAAVAIARELRVALTAQEEARLATNREVVPAAYDGYLRGRYQLSGVAETEEHTRLAVTEFQRALVLDPEYAPAYAGLARAFQLLGTVFQGQPPGETRAVGIAAARRAVALNPDAGEAHGVLARLLLSEFDWAGADESFRRAIELAPDDPPTLVWYAYHLLIKGRTEEALEAARRAESIDPLDLNTRARVGFIHEMAHQHDQAIRREEEVLRLDPNRTLAKFFLTVAYASSSRFDDGLALLRADVERRDALPALVSQWAVLTGAAGRRDESYRAIDQLLEGSRRRYISPVLLAIPYVALDDRDQAFAWFEKAYAERSNMLLYFGLAPILDRMKTDHDPRYVEMLSRIRRQHAPRVQ